jgi:hypothetical protein
LSDLTEAVSINGVVIKTSSGESFPQGGGKLDIGAYEYIAAAAALESRMGGLAVYDTDLDITRVADANLAASNTFGLPAGTSLGIHPSDWSTFPVQGKILANGTMTWSGAMFWIDAMNATYYLGVNNWYLPGTLQPDPSCSDSNQFGSFGSGCTGSPMGHLFYDELSGTAGEWVGTSGDPDLTLFSNFQTNYWSSAQYPSPSMVPPNNAVYGSAWAFNFANGSVNGISKNQAISAWAVTDGDVLPVLLRCDLNNNGEVDAGDLSQVLRMVLDNIADDLDCDINNGGFGDGVISTSDLVIVTRIVLGIIPAIYN